MYKIFSLLSIAIFLFACKTETEPAENKDDSIEQSKNQRLENENNQEDKAVNFKPIENESALIKSALQAVPDAKRDSCTIKGYNAAGDFVTYREGTNEIICLADDPRKDGFSAASYHISLEPFMSRGRALKKEGKDGRAIFSIREKEIKSGELKMGDAGSTLHVYYGPREEYDPETGLVPDGTHRYVVYLPFATAKSTGLPEMPVEPNHPWIMDPGTHKAHVMITPK